MPATRVAGSGTGACRCAISMELGAAGPYGGVPVSSSNAAQASEYSSARLSRGLPSITSGAR